ncbi:MAG TPA: HAD-IA family hydrolase [Bryobacteraceae bacterium]|jgi:sugar-phosphatase|nr:HAD-IA family hydrolase [Bryobacteraceae bacterium]
MMQDCLYCRAILFDMDGTLVDSNEAINRAWRKWAYSRSIAIPIDTLLRIQHGRTNIDAVKELGCFDDAFAEATLLTDLEEKEIAGLAPIRGAQKTVAAVQEGRWAIVTSADRRLAELRLKSAGLPIPDVFITAEGIRKGKPDPECYMTAAERLKVHPQDCVVFEDSTVGVVAARSANMSVVGVLTNGTQLGTAFQIQDFEDLTIWRRGQLFELEFVNSNPSRKAISTRGV